MSGFTPAVIGFAPGLANSKDDHVTCTTYVKIQYYNILHIQGRRARDVLAIYVVVADSRRTIYILYAYHTGSVRTHDCRAII